MLKGFGKFIKDKGIVKEVVNIALGIGALAALLVFSITQSVISLFAVVIIASLINILNGLSMYKNKEKRNMGMSMMMLGIVLVLFLVILSVMGFIK